MYAYGSKDLKGYPSLAEAASLCEAEKLGDTICVAWQARVAI